MTAEKMNPEPTEKLSLLARIGTHLGSLRKRDKEIERVDPVTAGAILTDINDRFPQEETESHQPSDELLIDSIEFDLADAVIESIALEGVSQHIDAIVPEVVLIEDEAAVIDPAEETVIESLDDMQPEEGETVDLLKTPRFAATPRFRRGKKMNHHTLGQHLIDKGLITEQILFGASKQQEITGEPLGQILVQRQYLSNSDRVQAILEVSAERIAQETVSKTRIPVDLLEEHKIIISTIHDDGIFVSTMGDERRVRMIIAEYYPGKKITFVPYSPTKLGTFIANMRKSADVEDASSSKETVLDRLVFRALSGGGSDIHFLPRGRSYSVFIRINGIMGLEYEGTMDEFHAVIAQAKNRSRLDASQKHMPQTGSFQIEFNRKAIDLRVSCTPNIEGECMVIRVLDPEGVNKKISRLGITHLDKWLKGATRRSGLCLVCGSTGTGKTTTLNSTILNFNREEKKIITIENPVEIRISGVSQVSINESIGFTYNKALEAQLTQDPDVIVVGEVKDEETARTIIRAATSGHMVFGTLHTGSIEETLNRLMGLGIKDHELRYILRSIMAQDLIKTTCPTCNGAGHDGQGFSCHDCLGEGYSGRTVVSEVEYFHDSHDVDRFLAVAAGREERTWTTIVEDAVLKYREGRTTVQELDRLFGQAVVPYLNEEGI